LLPPAPNGSTIAQHQVKKIFLFSKSEPAPGDNPHEQAHYEPVLIYYFCLASLHSWKPGGPPFNTRKRTPECRQNHHRQACHRTPPTRTSGRAKHVNSFFSAGFFNPLSSQPFVVTRKSNSYRSEGLCLPWAIPDTVRNRPLGSCQATFLFSPFRRNNGKRRAKQPQCPFYPAAPHFCIP